MSFTPEDIHKIAHLARLNVTDQEITHYTEQLSRILQFIEQMDQVDTNNVAPLAHPLDVNQRLRPDIVTAFDEREKFQKIAPCVEAGLYLVPKVIE